MLYSCITIMRVIVLLNSVLQTLEETNSVQSNFWSSPISMAVPDCCRVRCWNRSLYMDDECLSSFCLNCSSNKLKLGDRCWNLPKSHLPQCLHNLSVAKKCVPNCQCGDCKVTNACNDASQQRKFKPNTLEIEVG